MLCGLHQGSAMNKLLLSTIIAATFISLQARAQERAGSAALGAVSGAVVLGPVGAIAGALIGYTAGAAIAHSWGVRRSSHRPRAAHSGAAQSHGTQEHRTANLSSSPLVNEREAVAPAAKASETVGASKTPPPVQGFE